MKQNDIDIIMKEVKKYIIHPKVIATKKEANSLNKQEKFWNKAIGIKGHKWKIGMEYYEFPVSKRVIDIMSGANENRP
jgi:hypothetical protein